MACRVRLVYKNLSQSQLGACEISRSVQISIQTKTTMIERRLPVDMKEVAREMDKSGGGVKEYCKKKGIPFTLETKKEEEQKQEEESTPEEVVEKKEEELPKQELKHFHKKRSLYYEGQKSLDEWSL